MSPADQPHASESSGGHEQDPLALFTGCHARIRENVDLMRQIPAMLARGDQAQAAKAANDVAQFFESTVIGHHREEERILWPMLDKCAPDAQEHETVKAIEARIKSETEEMEALWGRIEPRLSKLARGKAEAVDAAELQELSTRYDAHADYEDAVVVPMARFLIDPTEQHRLAIAVAVQRMPIRGYI